MGVSAFVLPCPVRAFACVRVRACLRRVRACVRACVRVHARVRVLSVRPTVKSFPRRSDKSACVFVLLVCTCACVLARRSVLFGLCLCVLLLVFGCHDELYSPIFFLYPETLLTAAG